MFKWTYIWLLPAILLLLAISISISHSMDEMFAVCAWVAELGNTIPLPLTVI